MDTKQGKKFTPLSLGGKTGNIGGGNSTEQWWGHVDRVKKMREEVRAH